jgi:demethylmenaquinone methyltransferase/2-methoxy-6-polyprenyl-1,4-benzoquinol methylase
MTVADRGSEQSQLVAEQIAYYRAIAAEYEAHAIPGWGGGELKAALDAFEPTGNVLEIACGTGVWTSLLLRHAATVTALDAAPEMLAIAKDRINDARVRFVEANVFDWEPEHKYDVVSFSFSLSHVPLERFDPFWSLVAACLKPRGRVFFVDDTHRAPDELIDGESGSTVRRRSNDGSVHRVFKIAHTPAELERRLLQLGWEIRVVPTSGPFFWGAGMRS